MAPRSPFRATRPSSATAHGTSSIGIIATPTSRFRFSEQYSLTQSLKTRQHARRSSPSTMRIT